MKRDSFDLVIGMGSMCACSQALRQAGLQLMSMPFDWNGGPGIRGKTDLLVNGFRGFIQRDRMTHLPEPRGSYNQFWDDDLGFKYYHDFPIACDFESEFPKVQQKYQRRIERLYDMLEKSKRVLIVYVGCQGWPDCTSDDAAYCLQRLAERWPAIHFEFLLFRYQKGLPFKRRREERVENCRTLTFDYQDLREQGWRADFHLLGRWLVRQYAVRDYRTPEERKAWASRDRRAEYERFKATNFLQLLWRKEQFKLYKHLWKYFEKLGITLS